MWFSRQPFNNRKKRVWNQTSPKVAKDFQRRYIGAALGCLFIVLAAAIAPAYYFFLQNHSIFTSLAYQQMPDLIPSLEREKTWMIAYLSVVTVSTVLFVYLYFKAITAHMISPLLVLENHIRKLREGKSDYSAVKIREKDEFHHLVQEYNLLVDRLKAEQEKLKANDIIDLDGSPEPSPDSRRVS